jgi:hypothetical protein
MTANPIRATVVATIIAVASVGAATFPAPDRVQYRDVTVPAGTVIPIVLDSHVASDTSRIESPVRAHSSRAIVVNGMTVIPAGSALTGHVTSAQRSGRVRGRARVAFRFDRLTPAETNQRLSISTSTVSRIAPATKARDARTIAIPAAGGAVVGGILGGKKGAAIGAAAGGGGGTAVVLSTRGREVRLGPGATASVRLLSPITVRVPID